MNSRPLNLLVICLDTFRMDCFMHQSPWNIHIPRLDQIRKDSIVFTSAFGEGQPTIPIRRAYFTGQRSFPWRFRFDAKGMWPSGRGWHKISPEQETMAEILLRHGYQTGLISDTYHMFKSTANFTRGFMQYEFVRGYESDNYRGGRIDGRTLRPFVRDPDPKKHPILTQYLLNVQDRHEEEDWLTAQTFSRAERWLTDHRDVTPFFLWVDSFGPHEPWDPPREYLEPYATDPSFEGIEFIYPVGLKREDLSASEAQRVIELYLAYLTFVDTRVGRLLDTLDRTGQTDHTVVMIVSDHGTELLDHGQFSKHPSHLYTHNTQLIWTIRHPHKNATHCDALVQSHDVFPTALSLLRINYDHVDGENAWQWIQGKEPQRDVAITGWGSYAAVRTVRWNYFVNFENPELKEVLFDRSVDPLEMHDVISEYPKQARELRQELESFLGSRLPVQLNDTVGAEEAPIRVYLGSNTSQDKRDAGFV